jgi:hypothetical protein
MRARRCAGKLPENNLGRQVVAMAGCLDAEVAQWAPSQHLHALIFAFHISTRNLQVRATRHPGGAAGCDIKDLMSQSCCIEPPAAVVVPQLRTRRCRATFGLRSTVAMAKEIAARSQRRASRWWTALSVGRAPPTLHALRGGDPIAVAKRVLHEKLRESAFNRRLRYPPPIGIA